MTDTWQPNASLDVLRQRARLLQHIRQWFANQQILEVETPQLSMGATTDPHIDSFVAMPCASTDSKAPQRQLRTSAEFHMKRLLASGSGDIYELGKVFRVDEIGPSHNPEFTMLEWYRVGMDHHQLIDDVESLLKSLHEGVGKLSYPGLNRISYRALWKIHVNIDIATASCDDLKTSLENVGCDVPDSIVDNFDTLLDLGMSVYICHQLAPDQYTCIVDYPASQASLARIDNRDGSYPVAQRFEFYFGSTELANGYHELTDAEEQRARFQADNHKRISDGKQVMPVDEAFLASLQSGLPDCAGVAIGVDRLLMLLLPDVESLQNAIAFNWNRA